MHHLQRKNRIVQEIEVVQLTYEEQNGQRNGPPSQARDVLQVARKSERVA